MGGVFTDVSGIYLALRKLSGKEVDRENLLACATAMSSFIGMESGDVLLSFMFLWFSSFNAKAENVCLQYRIKYNHALLEVILKRTAHLTTQPKTII